MTEIGLSREFVARASMVAVLAGVAATNAACSGENGAPQTPPSAEASTTSSSTASTECQPLHSFNLIGGSKEGGINAKNTGECVDIYDMYNPKTVGRIANGGAFIFRCDGDGAKFLVVEAGGVEGKVDFHKLVSQELRQGSLMDVPDCPALIP